MEGEWARFKFQTISNSVAKDSEKQEKKVDETHEMWDYSPAKNRTRHSGKHSARYVGCVMLQA